MKKLLIILLILSIFLTACTVQESSEVVSEEIVEELTDNLEIIEEEQEALEVAEEVEEVTEEELPEEVVEAPKEDIKYLKVAEGDTVTAYDKTIFIETIDNYGSLVAFRANGLRTKLMSTRMPEVLDGYVYEIVESTFNKDSMVTLSMKPLVLGANEYYLKKPEKVTVNNVVVELGDVKSPTHGLASTYIAIPGVIDNLWIREGESKTEGGLKITLVKAFYLFNDAAILKIVPA
ncbi:MAG: hypothetical protein KKA65_05415 [Nanoarchaeota archaeon]|nr:hypothetical protein [Nanoarchaeota archaeon]MBU4351662.1 hypothetical protein [Nanoarchaeota archaeon]MBU4456911.1 hypothetical protein [Nanoarchaeota archaeon]MCG2720041.1 hypothetical protein [Nanoarchaeota archaeon]